MFNPRARARDAYGWLCENCTEGGVAGTLCWRSRAEDGYLRDGALFQNKQKEKEERDCPKWARDANILRRVTLPLAMVVVWFGEWAGALLRRPCSFAASTGFAAKEVGRSPEFRSRDGHTRARTDRWNGWMISGALTGKLPAPPRPRTVRYLTA